MEKAGENKNDLFVRVKATRLPKQETSSEASDEITMVTVDVQETKTEEGESIELCIHIQRKRK